MVPAVLWLKGSWGFQQMYDEDDDYIGQVPLPKP